jgi:carbon-monoxide dehydrogenase small subunit
MATYELLEADPDPSEEEILEVLGGQLCRCTGYQGILRAVHLAAATMRATRAADAHA